MQPTEITQPFSAGPQCAAVCISAVVGGWTWQVAKWKISQPCKRPAHSALQISHPREPCGVDRIITSLHAPLTSFHPFFPLHFLLQAFPFFLPEIPEASIFSLLLPLILGGRRNIRLFGCPERGWLIVVALPKLAFNFGSRAQ